MNTTSDRKEFLPVVPSYFDEYGLEPMEYRLYAHIVRRAGKNSCFESIPNMARSCLMNEKTVRKSLRVLVAARLIKVVQERKGRTSIYELTQPGEWLDSQSLPAIRQEFTTNSVNQNLSHNGNTPDNNGSGTKSGRGVVPDLVGVVVPDLVGVVVPNLVGVVVPDLVDEVYPNKVIPSKEFTPNAALPTQNAFPTQESCVCETEQLNLEKPTPEKPSLEESAPQQPTPQQPTSLRDAARTLSKNPESSQQTDNPSRRSTIAPGSFEKSEQSNNQLVAPNPKSASPTSLPDSTCYTIHPTEKTEQAMQKTGLPSWMDKAGPNGWKAEFVESYRQYLNSTPRYAKELIRQATTGEAKNALTRLSKTFEGKVEIQNHWDSFNELKERQQHQQQHQPHHSSDDALAKAIADDEERRRFEQQQHSWVPMPQKDAVALKAKLQAAVSSSKVPSNTRPSSTNLREVEAQLKLAR
ncbi:Periplasmic protein TonB, links inner and outer membranes (plasmid) [Nostoc flagelliforme CCNUN1]|uniref:Periplasmic protein TonB, links inner and outer membranes n=1 Tax=Nostoc flagelliforme CCNUN1 TaxID=2038116 RepID=A0A2K8T775_9NOSO|nr:helix-turn-helix domain-containing protein [Nostoc flagelliforme]AUB43522.1 Periplasmic protein TonB, links inner and outer membranes [Nostoc flagelliforme CCNUN1]